MPILFFGQSVRQKKEDVEVTRLIQKIKEAHRNNRVKSLSYLNEALTYENKIADSTLLRLYFIGGIIYKDQESYFMSLNLLFKSLELQNKVKPSLSFLILNNIGGCYYELKDFKKARHFWEQSLVVFEKQSQEDRQDKSTLEGSIIYNNLAVLEMDEGNYAKALDMLKIFEKSNIKANMPFNVIMAYENLAQVYIKLNETDTAKDYYWKGIALSKKMHSSYDLASLYSGLGELYQNLRSNKDSIITYTKQSYDISMKNTFTDLKLTTSQNLFIYYKSLGDFKMALAYLEIAKSISEETIRKENLKNVSGLELEFNEKMKQNDLIIKQNSREKFFKVSIIVLILILAIVFLLLRLQKIKVRNRIVENQLLVKKLEEKNTELNSKNKQLANKNLQMLQTSEIIESTHKELIEIREQKNLSSNERILSRLIYDLKKGSQSFNKDEFEKFFMEIDSDFYKRLLDKFPYLTKNELRLCAFLKLNLSSKEISAITMKNPQTIAVARSRLRKKMGLDESENLVNFLIQF